MRAGCAPREETAPAVGSGPSPPPIGLTTARYPRCGVTGHGSSCGKKSRLHPCSGNDPRSGRRRRPGVWNDATASYAQHPWKGELTSYSDSRGAENKVPVALRSAAASLRFIVAAAPGAATGRLRLLNDAAAHGVGGQICVGSQAHLVEYALAISAHRLL